MAKDWIQIIKTSLVKGLAYMVIMAIVAFLLAMGFGAAGAQATAAIAAQNWAALLSIAGLYLLVSIILSGFVLQVIAAEKRLDWK